MAKFICTFAAVVLFFLNLSCGKNDSSTNSPLNQDQGISVEVTSSPLGANIDVDGGNSGHVTPYTFLNMTAGSHRFRIYITNEYSQVDTILYLQQNDHRTLTVSVNPLWNFSWTGNHVLHGQGDYWNIHTDSMKAPSTLNAKIQIDFAYSDSFSIGHCTVFNFNDYRYILRTSPFMITKDSGLQAGRLITMIWFEYTTLGGNITIYSIKFLTY